MAAAVTGFCDFGLDAENVRATERRDVDTREEGVDHPVFAGGSSGACRESRELVGICSLRLGRCQAGDPGFDRRRQVLARIEARPERRLAQVGIEFRIVAKPQLVDHLLGDVARLQDESLVLHAFGVGTDVGDDRFDVGQARRLDADQHPRFRDVEGGHRPCAHDRRSAQHQRADGDQPAPSPELADGLEETLFLRRRRQARDRFPGHVVRRRWHRAEGNAPTPRRRRWVRGIGHQKSRSRTSRVSPG